MSEIDKSELHEVAVRNLRSYINRNVPVGPDRDSALACVDVLLTAPSGWKLVPIPPTDEMIDAAQDAHMPFGDMHFAITSAILASPEPK